jgi:hypothetical protein
MNHLKPARSIVRATGLGVVCWLGLSALSVCAQTTVSVTDTSGWNPWRTGSGAVMVDVGGDQQTGQGADDFIGNSTGQYAFMQNSGYLASDPTNQYVLFRTRMGNYQSKGFGGNLEIGLDLTGSGSVNLIMKMQDKTGTQTLTFASPGAGANNSPSTTTWGTFTGSIALTTNTYNYVAVTDGVTLNSNGTGTGDTNSSKSTTYTANSWVTFAISYANLQNAIRTYAVDTSGALAFTTYTVNDNSMMSFIGFTSTQGNAINQDLFGTNGNVNSSTTFANLGAGTALLNTHGTIPEASTVYQLGAFLLVGAYAGWRRRKAQASSSSVAPAVR